MPHLLIAEDDELLRDALAEQLEKAGYQVTTAANGAVAQYQLEHARFDGVLLDLGLPMIDGLTLLEQLRQRQPALPVLILTAMDDLDHRVRGLNAGADDYLTKPFDFPELDARLKAMLRRAQLPAYSGTRTIGHLSLDAQAPRATVKGQTIELTQREWTLATLLVSHAGQVVTREEVLNQWQADPAEASNALEVYVHRLRRKLAGSGVTIRNVRGLGYLLEEGE